MTYERHPAAVLSPDHRIDRLVAGCPDAFVEVNRGGVVVEWNTRAETIFGWTRDEVVGQFAADTFVVAPFTKTPIGLLVADSTGAAVGPATGSVTAGTLDLVLEFRHRDGHRVRTPGRLVVLGHGRQRSVACFLRPPVDDGTPSVPRSTSVSQDALTGLADRSAYVVRLADATATLSGTPGSVAVVLLDLDRFKAINNSLGHALGDGVLTAVARRIESVASDVDLVARFGGDEFLALITDPTGKADAKAAAFIARLQSALSVPFPLDGAEVFLDASVGVALNTFGVDDPGELVAHAEAAMYSAKRRGGFGAETFGESLRIDVLDRMATEHSLHRALERSELVLHYQPFVEIAGATTVGVEALIRWEHPEQGLVAPGRFISVAEESGLIIPIGAWTLEEACRQLHDWRLRGEAGHRDSIQVNLSARQIDDSGIVDTVEGVLSRTGLSPEHLTLEITESALMREAASALTVLRSLKALGVRLAIDDFGTGYSSLSYLQRFPLDVLKIDRSFVEGLGRSAGCDEIVSAVIQLAHALGLEVVAEGVETYEQLEVLRWLACDFAQGFLFSRPLPADELRSVLGLQLTV